MYLAYLTVPAAALIPLVNAAGPINDIDAYWHVVVGRELIERRNPTGLGDDWAWFDPPTAWTTSQWLSEAGMAWSVNQFGWVGLPVLTWIATLLLLVAVTYTVFVRAPALPGVILVVLYFLALSVFIQSRPALLSAGATLIIAHHSERLIHEGKSPPLWLIPFVLVWANLHGQWVLAPMALTVALIAAFLGRKLRWGAVAGRTTAVIFATIVAGTITPLGVQGLLLPIRLSTAAGDYLLEWRATALWSLVALPLCVTLGAVFIAWIRDRSVLKAHEATYVAIWFLFSLQSYRSVLPATLMILPMAARLVGLAFSNSQARTHPRSSMLALGSVSLVAVVLSGLGLTSVDPLMRARPLGIAKEIAARDTPIVVLNDYNVAGVLVAFGSSGMELGIDGRVERYGHDYLEAYSNAMTLRGDTWNDLLDEMQPDVAVLEEDAPIGLVLEARGWTEVMRDSGYVLLAP